MEIIVWLPFVLHLMNTYEWVPIVIAFLVVGYLTQGDFFLYYYWIACKFRGVIGFLHMSNTPLFKYTIISLSILQLRSI